MRGRAQSMFGGPSGVQVPDPVPWSGPQPQLVWMYSCSANRTRVSFTAAVGIVHRGCSWKAWRTCSANRKNRKDGQSSPLRGGGARPVTQLLAPACLV